MGASSSTTLSSGRSDGIPRHEPIYYLGVLTDAEAQGIRNALEAAENPGLVYDMTIRNQAHYLRVRPHSWRRPGERLGPAESLRSPPAS